MSDVALPGSLRKQILVVDDELLIRRALADYLTDSGYETVMAADGAEALREARARRFHAVLVDLRMPNVDGLEVIAALKIEQPGLPLVVVSGTGILADVIEAIRLGAWDYITKPIQDMEEVTVVVERVLEIARLREERDRYQNEMEDLNRSLEAEVARQTEDLRARNRRLAALNRVSYAISDPVNVDTMLNRAIRATVSAIDADGGVVRLLNPVTNELVVVAARGLPDSYLLSARAIPLGEGIIGQVAQSGFPSTGEDFTDDPWMASLKEEAGIHSYLCVPLRAGHEMDRTHPVVGTLGVAIVAERDFDVHETDLLSTVGNQIGVALARARYASDLERTNTELERANAELRRLDTLREQFIQNVTHELRTPLALVHGYVEMLTQGGLSSDEQEMALDVASRRVQVLVELVQSITTLQDLDSRPLCIESVEPVELLQTVCKMVAQRALVAGIELETVCPEDIPVIPGDFTRLAQAIYQIVDNACKFSPDGGVVCITAAASLTGDQICISVNDQGIGIPAGEHERIFERFYQVDGSTTRRFGGTGLGLALAREIVQAHGGQVTVESKVGGGSTFFVRLPLDRLQEE